jgi:hypothetical protein
VSRRLLRTALVAGVALLAAGGGSASAADLTEGQREAIAAWKAQNPGRALPFVPRGPDPDLPPAPVPVPRGEEAARDSECSGVATWGAPVSRRADNDFGPYARTYFDCFNLFILYNCQSELRGLQDTTIGWLTLARSLGWGVPGFGCSANAEFDPDVLESITYDGFFRYYMTRLDGRVWGPATHPPEQGSCIGYGTPQAFCEVRRHWGPYEMGSMLIW